VLGRNEALFSSAPEEEQALMAIWATDRHIHNVGVLLDPGTARLVRCVTCRFIYRKSGPFDTGTCVRCWGKFGRRFVRRDLFRSWQGQDLVEGIYQKIQHPHRHLVDFQPLVAIQLVVQRPKRRRTRSVEDMTTKVLTAVKNTLNPNGETDVKRVAAHLGWNPRRKAQKCLEVLQKQGYLTPSGEMLKFTQKGTQALDARA
jgi:hypothetical protein